MFEGGIQFHKGDEWTAVYLNGVLQLVGNSYEADDWLRSVVGVKEVIDDAFMLGQEDPDEIATHLDEIIAYQGRSTPLVVVRQAHCRT